MTKVIKRIPIALICLLLALVLRGKTQDAPTPAGTGKSLGPGHALYLQLRTVGLDKSRVYRARDVSFNRSAIHIALEDGTIAFTEDVEGKVTGAFFEGDGEVLLSPPNQVERMSMALFTGAAILEERFITAYFRFNDDTYQELLPQLRPASNANDFVNEWNETARNLATLDGLRLLVTFSKYLPSADSAAVAGTAGDDRMLHARVQGRNLGAFDLDFDSLAGEQVRAGQLRTAEGESYYDVWTAFAPKNIASKTGDAAMAAGEEEKSEAISISKYQIRAEVQPPTELEAGAKLQIEVHRGGQRALLFELSRFLQVEQVEEDGHPVEFVQNPSLEGTQLARRGDDIVAVVFPRFLRDGERLELRFKYRGQVLSEAGSGLLYVGARGIWYPNRGPAMSSFEMEFHYPAGWTLVATGKRGSQISGASGAAPDATAAGEQVSRWISDRPIPFAGFNLGKYHHAVSHAGPVTVDTYAATGVEHTFPQGPPTVVGTLPTFGRPDPRTVVLPPPPPSPARNEQQVADKAAQAIEFFSRRFGPFPYAGLAVTQLPGDLSQGWPGLIFLSSYAFLTPQEESDLHLSPVERLRSEQVIAHETAHQWWGDLLLWRSYRDQWLSEGLADYSSMMMLETEDPAKFHALMDDYREQLLRKNKDDAPMADAGPVTLGARLCSSHFPRGYSVVSYGRGAWLFHMLRSMLEDGAIGRAGPKTHTTDEDPFLRGLRKLRERYEGKSVGTRELLGVFEEDLPRSLWYDGRKSLDWFYQGWINGTAIPKLELENVKITERPGANFVSGIIRQTETPDDLVTSVPLYAATPSGNVFLGRVFADGEQTSFRFKAPAHTRKVVLDPNRTVLARLH